MILIEVVDAAFAIWEALVITIVVLAALAVPVLLVVAWAVTRAVKRAWRALCGPCGASDGPEAAPDVHDAPEALSAHTEPRTPSHPSWARTDKEAA